MQVQSDRGILNEMAKEVRAWCETKGWREPGDYAVPDTLGRTFGDEIALMHSELSEALEAFRTHGIKKWYDTADGRETTAPWTEEQTRNKPQGVGSELADLLIRLLDASEHLRIDLFAEYRDKMDYNETRAYRHGGKNL